MSMRWCSLVLLASFVLATRATAEPVTGLSHREKLYDVAIHGDVALVVGYPGLILRSQDRGAHFERISVPSHEALFAVDLDASGHAVIVGRNGSVLASTDGGRSFVVGSAGKACDGAALLDVDLVEGGGIVAVGDLGVIITSTDGGKTWDRRSYELAVAVDAALGAEAPAAVDRVLSAEEENEGAIEEARLSAVAFADASHGYIVGEFGLVLVTDDGGRTWQRARSGTGKLLFAIAVDGASHAIAAGAEGSLLETYDAGKTWSPSGVPTGAHLHGVSSVAQRVVVVGAHGVVLARKLPSAGFALAPSDVHTWLSAVAFWDAEHGLAVGGRGHLLRTSDGAGHFQRIFGE